MSHGVSAIPADAWRPERWRPGGDAELTTPSLEYASSGGGGACPILGVAILCSWRLYQGLYQTFVTGHCVPSTPRIMRWHIDDMAPGETLHRWLVSTHACVVALDMQLKLVYYFQNTISWLNMTPFFFFSRSFFSKMSEKKTTLGE